jgi:hypothetical protein
MESIILNIIDEIIPIPTVDAVAVTVLLCDNVYSTSETFLETVFDTDDTVLDTVFATDIIYILIRLYNKDIYCIKNTK